MLDLAAFYELSGKAFVVCERAMMVIMMLIVMLILGFIASFDFQFP